MVWFGLVLWTLVLTPRVGLSLLLTNFKVTSYRLNLTVADLTSPVQVSVDIDLVGAHPTDNISLHWGSSLDPPSKENFSIVRQKGSSPPEEVSVGQLVDLVNSKTMVTITTDPNSDTPTFAVNDKVTLSVRTRTVINKERKGLFSYQYNSDGSQRNMIATSLFPSYARELFPCVDEPSMPATFTLTVTVPASWTVTTSLPLIATEIDETTMMSMNTFASSLRFPTYALAIFISNDMRSVDYNNSPRTNITFWLPTYSTGSDVETSLEFLSSFLYKIENTLDLNFCLSNNLNIVLVPDLPSPFAGHGFIFIRNTFYSSSYYSSQSEGLFRSTMLPITYQFLRQFTEFSSRPEYWADFWLSSSMATYLQYALLNSIGTPFDFRTDLEVIVRQTALSLDVGVHSKPLEDYSIDGSLPSTVELCVMDPLKNLKGATLFSMLDLSFPAGSIFSTIKTLLQNHVESAVSSEDFYDQFTETVTNNRNYVSDDAKKALDNLKSWFNSSGYPLIGVTTDGTSSVTLKMLRFCQTQECIDSLNLWWSAHVALGSKTDPRLYTPRQDVWVDATTTTTIDLAMKEGDWVVANMPSGGYYRTQYSASNWESLAATITQLARQSHLLDDAFTLSEEGLMEYNVSLYLTVSHVKNRPYRDWYPIYKGLTRLRDYLLGTDVYAAFQIFFIPLLQNINSQVEDGLFSNVYDGVKVSSLFLEESCSYNIGNIRNLAEANLAMLLLGYPSFVVPSSSWDSLVCCGAEHSSSLSPQAMWKTVTNTSATYYKRHFNAIALGCFPYNGSTEQLKMFFSTYELENRNPYTITMLRFLAARQPLVLLSLIAEAPETFQNLSGAPVLASLVSTAGRKLNNNTQADAIKSILLAKVDDAVKDAALSTLDAISARTAWLNSHKSSIVLALQYNSLPNSTNSTSHSVIPITFTKLLLLAPCFIAVVTCCM